MTTTPIYDALFVEHTIATVFAPLLASTGAAPPNFHWERGTCPNEGHACNCIGACQPRLVVDEPAAICGTCEAAGDEPCRTRSGRVAKAWHRGRK